MTKPAAPRRPAKAAPRPSFEELRRVLEREQGQAAAVLPPAPMMTEQNDAPETATPAELAPSAREAGSPIGATSARRTKARPSVRGRRRKVRPVFVVSLARSGSTLLRYLLDSHPAIVSPPELNLSAILQHVVEVWNRTNEAMADPTEPAEAPAALAPDVIRRARKVVDEIMVDCANTVGASVYCDKSLTTVDHLGVVSQCYPDAAYIFLYRYPLDLIASGIEASRWGFNAYGFAPYLGAAPGNFVAGLGNYWIDRTTKMLEFERTCQVAHARVYYELLCDQPGQTLSDILDFLDLAPDETIIDRTFTSDHGRGPGDYKIDYTESISADSIGRGSTLPRMLAPNQIQRMNEMLAELDYPSVEAGWRGDLGALLGLTSTERVGADNEEIARSLEKMFSNRVAALSASKGAKVLSLDVVVGGGRGADKVVSIREGEGVTISDDTPSDPDASQPLRARCVGDVLLRVAAGEINLAQAVHDGTVSVERTTEVPQDSRHAVRDVMATLKLLLKSET
ncbi:MAG: sulfotransferase family protein [Acidimicrobiales bacterium]